MDEPVKEITVANTRDLERTVTIVSPDGAEAKVVLESLPVYLDLGWQKVSEEDYGPYSDLQSADVPRSDEVQTPRANPQVNLSEQQKVAAAEQRPKQ